MLEEAIKQEIDQRGTVVFPDVIEILLNEAQERGYTFLADELSSMKAEIEVLAEDAEEMIKTKRQGYRDEPD